MSDSLRVWDSGRRPPPAEVLGRAEALLQDPDERLLPLRLLAERFHVHVRTLRAAARDGRLRATFTNRAFFGQPVAMATGRAVATFLATGYGKPATQLRTGPTLVPVPPDCAARVTGIRLRLGVSKAELARRIGAAGKAVIYQWEVGKRRPSPVFWARLVKPQRRPATRIVL